jgi:hypothetical protein
MENLYPQPSISHFFVRKEDYPANVIPIRGLTVHSNHQKAPHHTAYSPRGRFAAPRLGKLLAPVLAKVQA